MVVPVYRHIGVPIGIKYQISISCIIPVDITQINSFKWIIFYKCIVFSPYSVIMTIIKIIYIILIYIYNIITQENPKNLSMYYLEVILMATKSILKDVKIRDKQLAHTFVAALSQAENSKYKPAPLTRECNELTGDKIKEFFGKNI